MDPDIITVDYLPLMEPGIDFNHWAVIREMNGVLSADDYDELRDF